MSSMLTPDKNLLTNIETSLNGTCFQNCSFNFDSISILSTIKAFRHSSPFRNPYGQKVINR